MKGPCHGPDHGTGPIFENETQFIEETVPLFEIAKYKEQFDVVCTVHYPTICI